MAKLNELISIVSSLSDDERKTLQRYLHCFDSTNENHDPKSERLLNLILHNNLPELKLFEKKFSKQAFSMLVLRLYDKILDTLIFDVNIKRFESYADITMNRMIVRKRLLYTQVLGSKSLFRENIVIYQKIISIAKEFEFYDELLIAMYELQNLYAALSRQSDFEALDKEILHFEEVRNQTKRAFNIYNKFTMDRRLNPENEDIINELEVVLPKLKTHYLLSKSAQTGWFYYRLSMEYHLAKSNYMEGYTICTNLLKLQQVSPAIRSDLYMGITYKMSSNFSLFLYNFDESLVSILKAQGFDKKLKYNQNLSIEIEALANFFKGNFHDSKFLLHQLTEKLTSNDDEFMASKYAYYIACSEFLQSNYKEVAIKLNQTKEIEKDKEGWNIAVRILGIMNQIDNENFDLADSRIESMRKHIERTMKEKDIRARFVIILRILRDLMNSSFDFKQIWETRQNYFQLLANDEDQTHRWRILSPELIRFDAWFEAKAKGLSYQEVFNRYVEEKRNEQLSKAI